MNKRIEEELADWRHRHFEGKRDGEHSGEYLERTSQLEIAQHFYDLALEDVKKWVGERADDNLHLWSVSDRGDAYIEKRDAFLSVRRYINSLKSK